MKENCLQIKYISDFEALDRRRKGRQVVSDDEFRF